MRAGWSGRSSHCLNWLGPVTDTARPDGYAGLASTLRQLLGIELSRAQLEAFDYYGAELRRWNQRHNLTAITVPVEIEIKHFVDSLTCLLAIDKGGRLVDVGSGAGFPGIPLKIVRPMLQVVLIEATGKKVEFCQHVMEGLGLTGIDVIHGRAEDEAHNPAHRGTYRWAVARAVAPMAVLAEYMLPFLQVGGQMIAMKGETGPGEAQQAEPAIKLLGGRMRRLIPTELPRVAETRHLIVVDKLSETPQAYPRRPGIPAKRPLAADRG